MGKFVRGDVVVLPFPFTDLSRSKRRPALVLADLQGDDLIICQITSRNRGDSRAVPITAADFSSGSLPVDSFVRPDKIFTADKNLIVSTAGHLSNLKIIIVVNVIINLLIPFP